MVEDLSDVVEELSSGTYVVTRRPAAVFIDGVNVEAVAAPAWAPEQTYTTGARASWDGEVFEVKSPGSGASSVDKPPSGRDTDIADGDLVWKWVAPAAETFTIGASVQPISGNELDRLPELLRTREVHLLITATELRLCTADGEGDLVTIDGATWEVQQVQRWNVLAGFCRCLVARRGR